MKNDSKAVRIVMEMNVKDKRWIEYRWNKESYKDCYGVNERYR